MNDHRVTHALIGTVPSGPEPPNDNSIASAKAAQIHDRVAALASLDIHGQQTLIELFRREVA